MFWWSPQCIAKEIIRAALPPRGKASSHNNGATPAFVFPPECSVFVCPYHLAREAYSFTTYEYGLFRGEVELKLRTEVLPQTDSPTFLGVQLDLRMTWKPLVEEMERQASRN